MAINYKLIKKEYRFQHPQKTLDMIKEYIDERTEFLKSDEIKTYSISFINLIKLEQKYQIYLYNGDLRNLLKTMQKRLEMSSDNILEMSEDVQLGKVTENDYLEFCDLCKEEYELVKERAKLEYAEYLKK